MQDYKKSLKVWSNWAVNQGENEAAQWDKLHNELSKKELTELLGILAGYFGATPQGRELLKSWQ